jgi:hypothetical protein
LKYYINRKGFLGERDGTEGLIRYVGALYQNETGQNASVGKTSEPD